MVVFAICMFSKICQRYYVYAISPKNKVRCHGHLWLYFGEQRRETRVAPLCGWFWWSPQKSSMCIRNVTWDTLQCCTSNRNFFWIVPMHATRSSSSIELIFAILYVVCGDQTLFLFFSIVERRGKSIMKGLRSQSIKRYCLMLVEGAGALARPAVFCCWWVIMMGTTF